VARPPLANSHWIEPGRLLAGEHPAGKAERATRKRLAKLVDAGIDCFLDLTDPSESSSYEPLLATLGRSGITYLRLPIRDHGLPESPQRMDEILAALDRALAGGRTVYLHCRAGIGRTNLVAGCWIANADGKGAAALERLNRHWRDNARSRTWPIVPETPEQQEFVRWWRPERDRPAAVPLPASRAAADRLPAATPDLRDRVRGMMLGLAAGDALGHSIHGLPAGAWADKTAMALCLAESLVTQDGNDAADQVARYREWQNAGHWSSTGSCVGISAATSRALAAAQWTGNPFAGSHDPAHADAEPLARIGPAVAWDHASPAAAIEAAVNATRVTHQAPLTLDAARFLAALLAGAFAGASKEELLSADFTPDADAFDPATLRAPLRELAAGAWRGRRPRRMLRGKYAAVAALESALAAFAEGDDLPQCLAAAAARPGDAHVGAAIVGELAGAHYGASSLPVETRAALARADDIVELADRLVDASPRARGA
jgi:ADP-ribosylglycohydrolase/protein-tyrosine phosphatase